MSKFKIGDKVKIPTTKSHATGIELFNQELKEKCYNYDYLLVDVTDHNYIALKFDDSKYILNRNLFLESDLEPYEEQNNVKSNNEEEIKEFSWSDKIKLAKQIAKPDSKCDIWKRLIFAYADENDYNAVKEIAALAEKLK